MGPAPPPAGTLSDISPLRLYYLAASAEQTGLLTFQLADRTIQVRFRKGNPEHVSSSHREDSIAEFLKAQKLLTEEQLKQAEAAVGSFGNDLVGALFGLGILNPGNAFANLAEQALTVLLKAMVAEAGSFTYQESGLTPLKVMPLGNRWAVLTAVLRRVPLPEIKRRLKDHLDVPLARGEGRVAIKDLPLTPQEVRAVNHLNGSHSLNALAREFPHDSDNLHRMVFMFRDLDLLSVGKGRPAPAEASAAQPLSEGSSGNARAEASAGDAPSGNARAEVFTSPAAVDAGARAVASARNVAAATSAPVITRNTPPPGGAAPPILTPARGVTIPTISSKPDPNRPPPPRLTPSGGSPIRPPEVKPEATKPPAPVSAAAAAELEELRATANRFKDDNYFQVLGIGMNADAATAKLAYIKLAKLYHPDTISVQSSPEVAKLKEEIFAIIGQAYRILSDDRSRANYREIVEGDGNQDMLPLAQVLLAEETFERGRAMVKAKRFSEAVKMLDDAIAGSEEVAEFYAWRGYAKFFAIDDKKRAQVEANKDLQIAVKKSEFCASAHYFLGQIAKLTGDPKAALKHFKKAVEIKPDHIDAKREVRLLAKK
ncbi:MAG TPA: DnaJ domain-containing protein [Myxococcaceae bacterium]|nr:DnaJ domain-containing protein [Myxococcaceae bacterium]